MYIFKLIYRTISTLQTTATRANTNFEVVGREISTKMKKERGAARSISRLDLSLRENSMSGVVLPSHTLSVYLYMYLYHLIKSPQRRKFHQEHGFLGRPSHL